ncbi:hypothetical protein N7457_004019 [Penicillium paradoxum]|uniref:uncharacterized protein n=1 Tax=Penicillium paradoxum TaxID=176176 RepID=UPI002547C958|nr:uncharacterized protein N7457_004019 [Penicillium paradoxum]KAJ5782245.1 hypothetical protein N7457_004019 [Penicillium paradoxum]
MANGACASCKAKKKRCTHRDLPAEVVDAETTLANMPSPSAPAIKGRRKATENNNAAEDSKAAGDNSTIEVNAADNDIADDNAKELSPGPVDSSDELSVVPSEVEKKKPAKKRTKRTRRSKAASQPQDEVPRLPTDPVEAACAMSVHTVFARELRFHIQEFRQNMEASRVAHQATMASAQTVQDTVDGWVEAWTSGR